MSIEIIVHFQVLEDIMHGYASPFCPLPVTEETDTLYMTSPLVAPHSALLLQYC